jgi:hypothetical protein
MTTQKELFIKLALDAWNIQVKRADNLFDALSDEQLRNEVAPNRNRGIYLLGHLTAVHDRMLPLLGFEEQLYQQFDNVFLLNPDRSQIEMPSIKDVRNNWKEVNTRLAKNFNNLKPEEWFQKHNSVSDEDFVKEPHRNRLGVLINRTNHLAYHLGQLAFLKK